MSTRTRSALLSAAAVCGLVLGGSATAAAADDAHSAHGGAKPGSVTLRLAGDVTAVSAARPPSANVVLAQLAGDPHQAKPQTWTLGALGGGKYTIKNDSGSCMKWTGAQKNGASVVLAKCATGNRAFEWHFVWRGAGYQVVSDGGLCLNVAGGPYVGRPLIVYACSANGATNDLWLPVWQG